MSCVFMMLTLAWLTVSLPFVNGAQQHSKQTSSKTGMPIEAEDDGNNPFANTTEEKTSGNFNSIAEEYLHDSNHSLEQYVIVPSIEYKVENVSTYIAFHGELISPPPDVA
ncbi:MAG: hypothetical protein ABIR18_00965 [Chitinophagaceae bacterium]